jgi:hypothetical protein
MLLDPTRGYILENLKPRVSKRLMAKGRTSYSGLVRGPHEKKMIISDLLSRMNRCLIFIVFAQFTNVAAGRRLDTHALRSE